MEIFLQEHEDCKILCLSEHWKTEDQLKNYSIANYNLLSAFCRAENQHGGCAIYIRDDLEKFQEKNLGQVSEKGHIECAAIEGKISIDKIIIINIYRPPNGDINIFLQKINEILSTLVPEKETVFLLGDFNIDLLKANKNQAEFVNLLKSYNLHQSIFQNTRITPTSQTCIDNIFTNYNNSYTVQVINSKI